MTIPPISLGITKGAEWLKALNAEMFSFGQAHGLMNKNAEHTSVHALAGRLQAGPNGNLELTVPSSLIKGVFDALDEPGAEFVVRNNRTESAIKVMTKEEVDKLGGTSHITERGHSYHYTLGPIVELPATGDYDKLWAISIKSNDLEDIRKSYGLETSPQLGFYIPVGCKKKKVTEDNKVSKLAGVFYHGSPKGDLQSLYKGSYVTPDLETAKIMARFHEATGKPWTDDDLEEPYEFGTPQPKWKAGREPKGEPAIYRLSAAIKQLNLLDNPYEHTTLEELPVSKMASDDKSKKELVRVKLDDNDGKSLTHHYLTAKKWDYPAGKVESNEDRDDAAVRELRERTGHHIDESKLKYNGHSDGFHQYSGSLSDVSKVEPSHYETGEPRQLSWKKEAGALNPWHKKVQHFIGQGYTPIAAPDGNVTFKKGDKYYSWAHDAMDGQLKEVSPADAAADLEYSGPWNEPELSSVSKLAGSAEDPMYLHSYIPSGSIKNVKEHGLLSGNELAKPENRHLLDIARPNGDADRWLKERDARLAKSPWTTSYNGPSVLFGGTDPEKIHDKHPIKKFNTTRARINLHELLKDYPATKLEGSELIPFSDEAYDAMDEKGQNEFVNKRHHTLSPEEITSLIARGQNPKDMWKDFKDTEGKYYASDVPHAHVVTPMGKIPSKYIEFDEETPVSKLASLLKQSVYWSKDVSRDLLNGRKYPLSYLTGELGELGESVKNMDWPNFKEELGDSAYAAQMILAQKLGLNLPLIGASAPIDKFYARRKGWEEVFKERGVPFSNDYLAGGSNLKKPKKIQAALGLAGHDISKEDARTASLKYGGGIEDDWVDDIGATHLQV